ncbi:MAG TPA: glycosyltransferase [Gemmatimonadaceae bacterium]|nr:glycosyltransferase [Gemmatimonadaceae bacterium]
MIPAPSVMSSQQVPERRRIRVLHIIQNLNYGGMERLLADIVRQADAERFESHVLVLQYLGRFAQGLEGRAGLHTADRLSKWSMLWPGPLVRNIRAIAPDVVHSHSGVWYKASMAARLAGVPLVVHTEHGRQPDESWKARLVDRLAARRTDVVVAVSELLRSQLIEKGISSPSQTRVIINGVDTETFRPRADSGRIRRERALSPAAPIIGSIGRLEHVKGYDIMVEAFALLCER